MKIIADAMGGDHAPFQQVKGAVEAAKKLDTEIILCGNAEVIYPILEREKADMRKIEVVHCSEVIENEDDPIRAVRRKTDSSLVTGMNLLNEGKGDALVSAGNTGAIIAASAFILKRMEGVQRPALTPLLPSDKGPFALLDAGANSVCTAENLYQFALMGSYYMSHVMGIENPRVALINIGAEPKKGTPLVKEAYEILKNSRLNFVGNIEARHLPYGKADVVVADGFTGNITLKLYEGLGKYIAGEVKNIFNQNILTKGAALLTYGGIKRFRKKMDYKEYGGAPLLGVGGTVIKAHGSSDARAMYSAFVQAKKASESNLTGIIAEKLSKQKTEV